MRDPGSGVTIWHADGTPAHGDTEEWLEYVGTYPSRQVTMLVAETKPSVTSSWRWLWNSVYGGHLTDQPLQDVAGELGLLFLQRDGRLAKQQITAPPFELAWTASFTFLSQMDRLDGQQRWIIPDFESSGVEIEF